MVDEGAYHCGIHGQQGGSWSAKNCCLNDEEVKNVVKTIQTQDKSIFANGIMLEGKKWTALRMEDDMVVVKGKEETNKEKTMTFALTKTAVVYGANLDSKVDGRNVTNAVCKKKDQLTAEGY